ncbi:polymorphic toxin-type HINT domain-containing protein [Marinactinospora rubrisoli]|uniref:Polymorphic toxin-type HINT domain-containing protein n=1 Tax=Marinactinospora rubrisoli TaxID=2715399 RepID=A0ABW2KF12_9ACTN
MLRRIHDPERGASLAEYAAVIVLVAAIFAAIAATDLPADISSGVRTALDEVLNPDRTGPAAAPEDPAVGAPEREPGVVSSTDAPRQDPAAEEEEPGTDPADARPADDLPPPVTAGADDKGFWGHVGAFLGEGVVGGIINDVTGFVESVVNGVLHPIRTARGAVDTAVGVYEQMRDDAMVAGLRSGQMWRAGDRLGALWEGLSSSVAWALWDYPLSIGGAVRSVVDENVLDAWHSGDYGAALGRGAWNLGSYFLPGIGAAGALSRIFKPLPDGQGSRDERDGTVLADGENWPPDADPPNNRDPDSGRRDTAAASCARNSFLAGTPVLMAGGGHLAIEQVAVGDHVLATDPLTGETGARTVTAVITGEGEKALVEITVTDDTGGSDTITATGGHPFWVPDTGTWVDAADLQPGTWLRTSAGTWVQVSAIEARTVAGQAVYNLTVDDLHTYYVGAGGADVLVHNDECIDGPTARDQYQLDYVPSNPHDLYLGAAHTDPRGRARENAGIHLNNIGMDRFPEVFRQVVNNPNTTINFDVSAIPGETLADKIKQVTTDYEAVASYAPGATFGSDGFVDPYNRMEGGITRWELYYLSEHGLLDRVNFTGL